MDDATVYLILEYLNERPVAPIEQAPVVLRDLMTTAKTVNIIFISSMLVIVLFLWALARNSHSIVASALKKKNLCMAEITKLPYDLKKNVSAANGNKWICIWVSLLPLLLTAPAFINLVQIENAPHRWLYEEARNHAVFTGRDLFPDSLIGGDVSPDRPGSVNSITRPAGGYISPDNQSTD